MTVGPDCVSTFGPLKRQKTYQYIIYNFSEDKRTIIVEKTSTSEDYDAFIADLPETECRFAVIDFHYQIGPAEPKKSRIIFINWCVVSLLCLPCIYPSRLLIISN